MRCKIKRATVLVVFFWIYIFISTVGYGQKRVLDTAALRKWETVANPQISGDGKWVLYYTLDQTLTKSTLVITTSDINALKNHFRFDQTRNACFSNNSKKVLFICGQDSLCILDMYNPGKAYMTNVEDFQLLHSDNNEQYALLSKDRLLSIFDGINNNNPKITLGNVSRFIYNEPGNTLLVVSTEMDKKKVLQIIHWIDLNDFTDHIIWRGNSSRGYCFDNDGARFCFMAEGSDEPKADKKIYYFERKMGFAVAKIKGTLPLMDSTWSLGDDFHFSEDGKLMFFEYQQTITNVDRKLVHASSVDIWHYKDAVLQPDQPRFSNTQHIVFLASVSLDSNSSPVLLKRNADETVAFVNNTDQWLICHKKEPNDVEEYWHPDYVSDTWLESTKDGSRRLIRKATHGGQVGINLNTCSPDGRWIVYVDLMQDCLESYDTQTGITCNISRSIPRALVYCKDNMNFPNMKFNLEPGCWVAGGTKMIAYDEYDIWALDPKGKEAPVNLTGGIGRKYHIKFRVMNAGDPVSLGDTIMLSAFNEETKDNGFYRILPGKIYQPQKLTTGPCFLSSPLPMGDNQGFDGMMTPIKAKYANVWVVERQSDQEAPNYYVTRDFREVIPVSDIQPQKDFNWYTSELIHYRRVDGTRGTAMLFKPENFDSSLRYPIIFNYYEHRSNNLREFRKPGLSTDDINIPWFASKGYIICVPDIDYHVGRPGEGALDAVVGAGRYLQKKAWTGKMGIQGHSWGGYETFFLATHTNVFSAVMASCGISDNITLYNLLWKGWSNQYALEKGQLRMGTTPWEHKGLYVNSSPVLYADQVKSPMLIMANKNDGTVPQTQGMEMFLALRRLRKKVWLLQYDHGAHGVFEDDDKLDYTRRLEQFFDYYLKGSPSPKWMTVGIPAFQKQIETGLELDSSGRRP